MERTTFLTAALAFAMIILMTATAQAKPFGGGNIGIRVLMQLDLSQDQKQTIYDILQKHQDEQQATRLSIKKHRQELTDLASDGNFDEDKARQAFQKSVPVMEEAFILRARIKSEIIAVLTPEQLEELQEIRSANANRRHGRKSKEFRNAMLETWLLMDSE